jgi:hypothetical protein
MSRNAAPDPSAADNVISIAAALDAPADAPEMAKAGDQAPFGGRDDDDDLDRPKVPAGCPVKPLGLGVDGQTCWYLNVLGQLVPLGPRDHGKNNLHALFTPKTHLLSRYWPRWSEPKYEGRGNARTLVKASEIVGFAQDDASEALIGACGLAGIFDAQGRVRGRGAHKGRDGALIVHFGDKVMRAGRTMLGQAKVEWFETDLHGGYVYPAASPMPRPHHEPVDAAPIERLLGLISTWNWRRRQLDPILALGWLAQTPISGALGWRSHLFVTGGRGTGKSSFNGKDGLCDRLLGNGALRTGSATEAAVRQILRAQTIPVIFDEFEPNAFNAHKLSAVLELARVASSGGDVHKGSSDHKAAEFVLNSCFQFSAILTPAMEPQDRSRFAILELEPFARREDGEAAVPKLNLDAAKLPATGAALMRRMFDGWIRWADTFIAYHDALTERGHSARSADTFGTLLACADLALYDHLPSAEHLDAWSRMCAPENLAEISASAEDHDDCLQYLATTSVQARGGDRRETIASWIGQTLSNEIDIARSGREKLGELGLKLVNARQLPDPRPGGRPRFGATEHLPGQPCYLAVAQAHRALVDVFGGSKWGSSGSWAQTLGRAPGALREVKVKFGKRSLTAVLVPIELVIDREDVPGFQACVEGRA